MAGIPLLSIKQKDLLFSDFRGALTENYVLTELISTHLRPVFWRSQQTAEVDFVCLVNQYLVPIEVKAEENVRSKSLAVYLEKYKPPFAVRLSMKNGGAELPLISAPLYLACRLADWF
jgi:predicted AAA+ superfamily ATPase